MVACGHSSREQGDGARVAESTPKKIGSYLIHVDPAAASGSIATVEPYEESTGQASEPGVRRERLTSVLLDVSFYGPGTWHPDTKLVTVTMRITNLSSNDLDEPFVQIVWCTEPTVVFEKIHAGDGGPGSVYAYADIEAPPDGANGASAKQDWQLYDPYVIEFSFKIELFANISSPASAVFPDNDDDRFNIEPGEWAGDDCDDNDPARTPEHGCSCASSCDTCDPDCCIETCTDDCSVDCSACACTIIGSPGNETDVTCSSNATCNITCTQPSGTSDDNQCDVRCDNSTCNITCTDSDKDCNAYCDNGAFCSLTCTNAGDDCEIDYCRNGSTCNLDCTVSGDDCRIRNGCDDASTCTLNCSNTSDDCIIPRCDDASICSIMCTDTGDDCFINRCRNGSTCDVTCVGPVDDACGVGYCQRNSTCSVTCDDPDIADCRMRCSRSSSCVMDCGPLPANRCHLRCGRRSVVDCGNNVWACSSTDCP